MTRCYRPWSKFNAHQWSNLNERGHFGIWIQESAEVLEPKFTVDLEGMTATVNWPAGLVPATYEQQDEIQRTFIGLASEIFAATCLVKDMRQTIERLSTSEAEVPPVIVPRAF